MVLITPNIARFVARFQTAEITAWKISESPIFWWPTDTFCEPSENFEWFGKCLKLILGQINKPTLLDLVGEVLHSQSSFNFWPSRGIWTSFQSGKYKYDK